MSVLRLIVAGFAAILCATSSATEEPQPKNVIFILVDDLGWTDLGCFGTSFYETPNIDRLAATGMKFVNAYAACPVCSPTRASILTGRYPVRSGITDYINQAGGNQPLNWKRKTALLPAPYADRLPLKETTIAEVLQKNGYATFFAGKWHLGPEGFWPEDQGFDVNQGGIERGGPYGGKRYFSPYGNPRLKDGPDGEHLPDRLATETVTFMKNHQDGPFFVELSFYSVHTPLISREDLKQKYLTKRRKLGITGPVWGTEGSRKVRLLQEHAVYAGMIEAMDAAVGKVLDGLDQLRLTEQTAVMLMSDNGGLSTSEGHPTSNLPLRAGKGWMYEGGIREPMIVRLPGVTKPGSTSHQIVTSTDFFPTILQVAGLDLQPDLHLDGQSFTEALSGKVTDRGSIFWHYPHYGNQGGSPSGAIRNGDWKLIEWYEDGRLELFNIRQDVSEQYNLVDHHKSKAAELHAELRKWLDETGALFPTKRKN